MNRGNILLIDDEDKLRQLLKRIISLEGFVVYEAGNLKMGMRQLEHEPVEVILCDVKLPDGDGVDFIEKVKTKYPQVEIIIKLISAVTAI
jgi:two-component system, NtrC family, response regulator